MYESPLFLAAHDEDGGGRSVPTTPLQVAAPGNTHSMKIINMCYATLFSDFQSLSVTVFTESTPSDSGDNMSSQSVPMVTASTSMPTAADEGDEVFMEQEREG